MAEVKDQYKGPYLERSGIGIREVVVDLAQPPKYELQPHQVESLYQYGNQIFDTEIPTGPDGQTETVGNIIRQSQAEPKDAPLMFADYFITGQFDITKLQEKASMQGLVIESPDRFTDKDQVYAWVAELIDRHHEYGLTTDDILGLGMDSFKHYKEKLATQMVEASVLEDIDPAIAEMQPFVADPEKMLAQLRNLERARYTLLGQWRDIEFVENPQTDRDKITNARRRLLEVHISKLSFQLEEYVPRVFYMYDQAALTGDNALRTVAHEVMPASFRQALDRPEDRPGLFKRMDALRLGLDVDSEAKTSSGVARRLWELGEGQAEGGEAGGEAMFSPEDVEAFKELVVSPEQAQSIIADIMMRLDLLSSEPASTYYTGRTTWAADGRWQAIINPELNSYAVDPITGTYKVGSQSTNLFSFMTVGGLHEFQHVWQGEADRRIADRLKIAGVRGRRVGALTEGGANAKQRAGTIELFGTEVPSTPAMTYGRARRALDNGEGTIAAVAAFYDEKLAREPDSDPKKTAKLAADRVARLLRLGGASSQAMAYAEEWLITDALADASPTVRARAMEVTCFDFVDQLRLHEYGMLPPDTGKDPDVVPAMLEVLQPYIERARALYKQSS